MSTLSHTLPRSGTDYVDPPPSNGLVAALRNLWMFTVCTDELSAL